MHVSHLAALASRLQTHTNVMDRPQVADEVTWETLIPREHWRVYQCVLDRAGAADKVPFALGGGLALGVYTEKFRRSKDLDLYILPENRDQIVRHHGRMRPARTTSMSRSMFAIGSTAATPTTLSWTQSGPWRTSERPWTSVGLRPDRWSRCSARSFESFRPKSSVVEAVRSQKDRCDWPDILNLMYAAGPTLDWAT